MSDRRVALCALALLAPVPAGAQTVQELQRQIDELKATIAEMKAAQQAAGTTPRVATATPVAPVAPVPPAAAAPVQVARAKAPAAKDQRAWYERLSIRGYAQMRLSEFLDGDKSAPSGISRLRSVQDGGIGDGTNFTFRRIRLILQGDLTDHVSLYLQPDFATAVSNQSGGERREGFLQLRDAYLDTFLDRDKHIRPRFGQSKVPYGWENMQSSSNRIPLDRSDGINSAVPGERDVGIVAYYTPPQVQRIWDDLLHDGQKTFGNYGAFGVGVYNGQGTSRLETNDGLMAVATMTWPFRLDGLGRAFAGQVLEVGGAAYRNHIQPELRSGGVSPVSFDDRRIGLHAILYPAPIGVQAEWNWGEGPEYDRDLRAITTKPLTGGYVQTMARVRRSPVGPLMPYARWQRYRGGWKALPNAPRLETDEWEFGVELQLLQPLELTLAYARMARTEADERRTGTAHGDLIRTQLQWNY